MKVTKKDVTDTLLLMATVFVANSLSNWAWESGLRDKMIKKSTPPPTTNVTE